MTENSRISGRFILPVTITVKSPLSIGHGEGEYVDLEVVKDCSGAPMIPGSSIAGLLRSCMERLTPEVIKKSLWGYQEHGVADSGEQSHIIISDLMAINAKENNTYNIVAYTSTAIEHNTNVARHGSLRSAEYVLPGTEFRGEIHIDCWNDQNNKISYEGEIRKFISDLVKKLEQNTIRAGNNKNVGYGELEWSNIKVYYIDFSSPLNWLEVLSKRKGIYYVNDDTIGKLTDISVAISDLEKNITPSETTMPLRFKGTFQLINAMMTGGGSTSVADKGFFRHGDKAYLPPTAVAGAIKARMRMWANTIELGELAIIDLLGGALPKTKQEFKPSRFKIGKVSYNDQNKVTKSQVQPRIAIDAFTGGVKSGALFDTEPLWEEENHSIEIEMGIESNNQDIDPLELNIFLLALRDLSFGDLPIGGEKGIGRGRVLLKKGTIFIGDKSTEIEKEFGESFSDWKIKVVDPSIITQYETTS